MAGGLENAIRDCRFQQLRFLVDSGLSVNHKNRIGQHSLVTALHIENPEKRWKMFQFLLQHKADFKAYDPVTKRDVLLWAVFLDRKEEAKLIMQKLSGDIDYHTKDKFGRGVIHYATMRGNEDLLKYIVQTMRKYDVNVDIRDGEGFTPYILAKRLGYQACVDILLTYGDASPHQIDQSQKKTAFQWESEGQKEKENFLKTDKEKKIATYKLLGRLPQLKEAHFDVSRVDIVESYKDRNLLSTSLKKEVPWKHRDIRDFGRVAARVRKYKSLSSLADVGRTDKETISGRLRRLSLSTAVSHNSIDDALRWINIEHNHSTLTEKVSPQQRSVVGSIPDIMTILEQQCSKAYRPVASDEAPSVAAEDTHKSTGTTSTMAIIFGKDGKKKIIKKEAQAFQGSKHDKKGRNKRLSAIKEVGTNGKNSVLTNAS